VGLLKIQRDKCLGWLRGRSIDSVVDLAGWGVCCFLVRALAYICFMRAVEP
jgi:hypothetical protein